MTYLISDIHGEYDMFLEMLKKINFSKNDILYILGDTIDRGPRPMDVVKFIIKNPNIILIRGNHEQMLLDSIVFGKDKFVSTFESGLWMKNGGFVSADQFLDLELKEQIEIYDYLYETPLYILHDNNIFVHAGVPLSKTKFNSVEELIKYLDNADDNSLIWSRKMLDDFNFAIEGYHIYCGHTPTYFIGKPKDIYQKPGYTVIDGGAFHSNGCLLCFCLETKEVFSVDNK